MRRLMFLAPVATLVVGACTSDVDTEASTTTGAGTTTSTTTSTTTGTGTATGAGTATGTATGTGAGGAGGSGGQGGAGGAGSSPLCDAVLGICTPVRWELCPAGLEPVDPDPHKDCPGASESIQGWCCVDAPPSSCSDDSTGDCVVGSSCKDCYGPLPGYSCEQGRVCCVDICG